MTGKQNGQIENIKSECEGQKPRIAGLWMKYGTPGRILIDFTLPFVVCPVYMKIYNEYGIFHIFNKLPFYEEYAIYNEEVPEVLLSMLFTTILFNLVEVFLFLHYRERISEKWLTVVIHHFFLVSAYFFFVCLGKYGLFLQTTIACYHFAGFPTVACRDWKSTFSYWQKCVVLIWVVIGYGFMHAAQIAIFYECYGPSQQFKPLGVLINIFGWTYTIFQTYYDYRMVTSTLKAVTDHKHTISTKNV